MPTVCLGQLSLLLSPGREMSRLRLRGEGLVWLIGAMVCLLAAPWVQLSVSAGNGWSHNALRYHWLMPISCRFRDCKALLVTSLTHVSGAVASVQTFIFTFMPYSRMSFRMTLSDVKCSLRGRSRGLSVSFLYYCTGDV